MQVSPGERNEPARRAAEVGVSSKYPCSGRTNPWEPCEAVAGSSFDKWGELEQSYHFVEEFEPELFRAKLDEATAERNKAQQMAADEGVPKATTRAETMADVTATHPRADKGHFGGRENSSGRLATTRRHSRGAEYLVRRPERDAPQIAEALGRGEYHSARAAGIVKMPTPLQIILRLLPRLAAADRAQLAHSLSDKGQNLRRLAR